MDKRLGRDLAQRHGLPVTGFLGLLVLAKNTGRISAVVPVIREHQDKGKCGFGQCRCRSCVRGMVEEVTEHLGAAAPRLQERPGGDGRRGRCQAGALAIGGECLLQVEDGFLIERAVSSGPSSTPPNTNTPARRGLVPQDARSNGGKRPSLNSGFHSRRG